MSHVQPQAFLALWNNITSDQVQAEYESWHSFEHVPERVGLPGFLHATRYRSMAQPLRYFTRYSLRSLEALQTPGYKDVFTNTTPWSTRMRLVLCDFYRLPCEMGGVHGTGSASRLATVQWRSDVSTTLRTQLNDQLQRLVRDGKVIRVEWGYAPPTDDYWLPNSNTSLSGAGQDHVLMLEHLDEAALRVSVKSLVAWLMPKASCVAEPEYFEQLTHVRQDELDHLPGTRRAPHARLFAQFTGD